MVPIGPVEPMSILVLLTQVLVTLVHATGMENLAEKWTKELKKESQGMDKVLKVEELDMMSNAEVEKVVETSGVLVISALQNSLGCVLHSQLARSSACQLFTSLPLESISS